MRRRSAIAAIALCLSVTSPADETSPSLGASEFLSHCAPCHGTQGQRAAAGAPGPVPPDLRRLAANNGGNMPEASLLAILDGRQAMRGHATSSGETRWGGRFSIEAGTDIEAEVRVTALLDYLDSLQTRP